MSLTARPRLYLPIRDERGELLRFARVRILHEDGKTPYLGKIYRDGISTKTYPNPFVAAPALVSVYLASPARIRVGVTPDLAASEWIGDTVDVTFDADHTVDAVTSLYIQGSWQVGGLLCGLPGKRAFWKPLRVDHEHETVAGSVQVGRSSRLLKQVGSFPGTTTVGADTGGWGAASSLNDSSTLGSLSEGYGRGTTALGHRALAEEQDTTPWEDGATSAGRDAQSSTAGVSVGQGGASTNRSTALGATARATAGDSVALGYNSRPSTGGVAIGRNTGAYSAGPSGSIGLGADAQYGLPSDQVNPTILLGAHDPASTRTFPWVNPNGSQSESPFDEYAPEMSFTGATVQLQRGLEWVAENAAVQVQGDVTMGAPGGRVGFYGTPPRTKPGLADDEPSSGITALDSLIFALRDLGLLRYRTEASMVYRAEDLRSLYLDGDRITSWPERTGADVLRPVPGQAPVYRGATAGFGSQPTVRFDNSVTQRSTRPISELRGSNVLPNNRHYLAVASHEGPTFGLNEGLFNLARLTPVADENNTVLAAEGFGGTRWDPRTMSRYTVDGLDQTSNRDARLPGPRVYTSTHHTEWPHARPVVGGPRDGVTADRWSGNVAEVIGMDETWEPRDVASMTVGLAFKYNINQPETAVRAPADNFLITQHDPMNGTLVFWRYDYPDAYVGKVQGYATRVPKPVIYIPFISIYIAFSFYSFRGALVGNWGNLAIGVSHSYEAVVSVKVGDLDGDGDMDVDVDVDVDTETHVGIFSLNNNFTWSMGQLSTRTGFKIVRIRHRVTKVVVCISGEPPFRYHDTDVQIYTRKPDQTLRLEATTPLWGDGSFKAWTKNPGKKIARVVERSTGNVLGTTEYQERALPRTALYADDDPAVSFANRDRAKTYEAALTALAILEMPAQHHYRARHIISTLQQVCNVDGTLYESYSAVLPAGEVPPEGASPSRWGAGWTILAVLRYWGVTGDSQFLAFARKLADKLRTQQQPETATNALLYFAFRDLAAATGVQEYATAAQLCRAWLLSECWDDEAHRFWEASDSDAEGLWADVMGGLFLLAIGDREKAALTIRHLKRFRVKGVTIAAPHYAGAAGLIGYKPYADMGDIAPHLAPPSVIDQPGSWAATLFKLRYGEPAGEDVQALYRWQQTKILNDPTRDLYAAQFLSHSNNATANGYGIRARPHLAAAGWARLLASGARSLFLPDPPPVPTITNAVASVVHDAPANRYGLRFTWQQVPVPAVAFEAQVQSSTDGTTWSTVSGGAIQGALASVVDSNGPNGAFAAVWMNAATGNESSLFRVRIRSRNATFGPWATTSPMSLIGIS